MDSKVIARCVRGAVDAIGRLDGDYDSNQSYTVKQLEYAAARLREALAEAAAEIDLADWVELAGGTDMTGIMPVDDRPEVAEDVEERRGVYTSAAGWYQG